MYPTDTIMLTFAIFLVAALYSSVGHAGASGYLAVMALAGVAPPVMRPAALVLNILVAGIGTYRFHRAGLIAWRMVLPFGIASAPCALVGGMITLPTSIYYKILGAALVFGAIQLARPRATATDTMTKPPTAPISLLIGAVVGLFAGLTGIGGGVFLSPLLILMRWADPRHTAGISVAFILVNSIAGLAGVLSSVPTLPGAIWPWVIAAVLGGMLGSHFGSRRFSGPTLRRLLALVLFIAAIKLLFA